MLKYLKLQNVGPAEEMELELGSRLNILTGDNGLGKSFLLDVAWFVSTYKWPKELNPSLTAGYQLLPKIKDAVSSIEFSNGSLSNCFIFERYLQKWGFQGKEAIQVIAQTKHKDDITIYLMGDGSFAVFDPYRNIADNVHDSLPQAYIFNPSEILNGLRNWTGEKLLSNGLILDWASWQKENGFAFNILKNVLAILSPEQESIMKPGNLTRIDLNDVRDMPTIEMPFEGKVPVVHASAGIRRILTFAYLLVWTWVEHLRAAEIRGQKPLTSILFLMDEVDAHLHPSWQRKIMHALLNVADALILGTLETGLQGDSQSLELAKDLNHRMAVQIIATTHSPLVMASLEPLFNRHTDAWFDLDLVGENGHRKVELQKREFEILGNADYWLTSEAFDLESPGSLAAEEVLKEAELAIESPDFNYEKAKVIYDKLVKVLPPDDSFFMRWNVVGKKEGWWK
jgi:hypothetical protein